MRNWGGCLWDIEPDEISNVMRIWKFRWRGESQFIIKFDLNPVQISYYLTVLVWLFVKFTNLEAYQGVFR